MVKNLVVMYIQTIHVSVAFIMCIDISSHTQHTTGGCVLPDNLYGPCMCVIIRPTVIQGREYKQKITIVR